MTIECGDAVSLDSLDHGVIHRSRGCGLLVSSMSAVGGAN